MAKKEKKLKKLVSRNGVNFIDPNILLPAEDFFNLAGEEFAKRLILTANSTQKEYCLRPDFTLPIAKNYLQNGQNNGEVAYGYLGSIFLKRGDVIAEYKQVGIEFLGYENSDIALDETFDFAFKALKIYSIKPDISLGCVAIFESLLKSLNIADVWRLRILHRFGNQKAMDRLLKRLADLPPSSEQKSEKTKAQLIKEITLKMQQTDLPISGSRTPDEIATRYLEKQELAASNVPKKALEIITNYLNIKGDAILALKEISLLAKENSLDISAPIKRILKHIKRLEQNFDFRKIEFDASFSPRLDYYTSIVFQMKIKDEILAAGGEYNRLLGRLGAKNQINATGCSLWVDRLKGQAKK
ncbi:MAG: ATP phosphoribosyltransferase regulatory subunit [Devosiaceae bacterium]|nr:ATP phosphoribosyltransferase regulatory subunit [Devosiaceae bacterium]